MEWIKTHWQIVVIALLACFSLSKCTQSCNRNIETKKITTEYTDYKHSSDSLFIVYTDSIKNLNTELSIANNKIDMLNNTLKDLKVSTEAMTKINDNLSKRNTQVVIQREQK